MPLRSTCPVVDLDELAAKQHGGQPRALDEMRLQSQLFDDRNQRVVARGRHLGSVVVDHLAAGDRDDVAPGPSPRGSRSRGRRRGSLLAQLVRCHQSGNPCPDDDDHILAPPTRRVTSDAALKGLWAPTCRRRHGARRPSARASRSPRCPRQAWVPLLLWLILRRLSDSRAAECAGPVR